MYKAEDILAQLDQCAADYSFPMLDNGYVYLAGTNLQAFRDDKRWLLIIEVIGFSYRGGGHNGITNCLHVFGNCLNYEPGTQNENFLRFTDNAEDCNTFDEEEEFYLNPDCKTFLLRDETTALIHGREKYSEAGIVLEDEEKIKAFEFLRLLDKLFHEKLIASDDEIKTRIPADIPKILELQNWHHPDLINDELPSQNETFIQIAKILETGNPGLYQASHEPNTHWVNWPEGGTL